MRPILRRFGGIGALTLAATVLPGATATTAATRPRVQLSVAYAQPGDRFTVTGAGFTHTATVTIRVATSTVTTKTTATGTFTTPLRVARSVHPGRYPLTATTAKQHASTTLAVHTDWPMANAGPRSTGVNGRENALGRAEIGKLTEAWRLVPRDDKWGWGDPVVAGGVVYVGADHDIGQPDFTGGELFAFDETTGKQLWQSTGIIAHGFLPPPLVIGDEVWAIETGGGILVLDRASGRGLVNIQANVGGGPAVVDNGVVYLAGGSGVAAIDVASHTILWKNLSVRTQPRVTVVDGVVVTSGDGLSGLDTSTGKILWSVTTPDNHVVDRAPVIGTVVVASFNNGELAGFDTATGRRLWDHAVDEGLGAGVPIAYNNTFIVWGGLAHPVIHGIDPTTGKIVWTGAKQALPVWGAAGLAYGPGAPPYTSNQLVVTSLTDGTVIDTIDTPTDYGPNTGATSLVIADSHLIYNDGVNQIIALAPTP